MSEPFQEDGYVWEPGSEERAVAQLRFDPDHGTELTLINAPWAVEVGKQWDVLHGESLWGQPWSLFDVGCRSSQQAANSRSACEADTLITGIHADSEAQIAFTDLALGCHGMREWLTQGRQGRDSALTRPADANEDFWGMLQASAEGVELLFHVNAIKSGGRYRQHFEATAVLQLKAPTPLTLTQWLEHWVTQVQDLMVFGMRWPSSTISLSGIRAGAVGPNGLPFDVKMHAPWHPRVPDLKPGAYLGRALLPANAVDDIGALITQWFALHRELGDAAQLFFGTINDRDLPALNRMLNLLAFAETYHRRRFDEPPLAEEEHDTLSTQMLDELPSRREHDVYAGRLRYANAQSQRQRVRWLVTRAATSDPRLEEVKRALVDSLIETRNHLTHFDPPNEWVSTTSYGYALLAAALEFVLEANILLDLGLTEEQVQECLAHGHGWDDPIPELPTDEAPGRA
jgi:ApeA N-terminal domain 1